MFSKNEKYYYNNTEIRGPNNRNLRTIWDINTQPSKISHEAMFPVKLVEPCMSLTTNPGEMILDPFIGSGTTGSVALQMNRRFIGIELNPKYAKIAEQRLNGAIIHA